MDFSLSIWLPEEIWNIIKLKLDTRNAISLFKTCKELNKWNNTKFWNVHVNKYYSRFMAYHNGTSFQLVQYLYSHKTILLQNSNVVWKSINITPLMTIKDLRESVPEAINCIVVANNHIPAFNIFSLKKDTMLGTIHIILPRSDDTWRQTLLGIQYSFYQYMTHVMQSFIFLRMQPNDIIIL